VIEQERRSSAVVEAVVTVAVLGLSVLIGYALGRPNNLVIWIGTGAVMAADAILHRWWRRSRPVQSWQPICDGFAAPLEPKARIVELLSFLGYAVPVSVLAGTAGDPDVAVSAELFWPVLFGAVWLLRWRIRPDEVEVTPAGVKAGGRLHAWADVASAQLDGHIVILVVRQPRRFWRDERNVRIDAESTSVPAAEIHWLIQHYLLFPADRERMTTLPTREFALSS